MDNDLYIDDSNIKDLQYNSFYNDAKEFIAIKKTNLEAMNKLIKLQKNNKTIDPIEFERYILNLYEKNLKEILKNQK